MNKKYKEYPNYIKINRLNPKNWNLTSRQVNLLMQLSREIESNESRLLNAMQNKEVISVFWKQLLYFEQNRNSNIEGSQTQFDELFNIDRNFSDNMSWETRNIIDVALELFKEIRNETFMFNLDSIITLHKKLYLTTHNKLSFDNKRYIEHVRPGYILKDGDPINWIGKKTGNIEKDLEEAMLIPVIPEEKKKKLQELVEQMRNKIDSGEFSILEISRFHVLFEGIHPFADGNGRLGRLLVLALMQMIKITQYTILPISEVIHQNKDEYIKKINQVQVSGNINAWNSYFIELLIKAKRIHEKIIKKSTEIIEQYSYIQKNSNKWIVFLKFFKHIKLKRDITVNKLVSEGMSQATAYRLFDEIANTINASRDGEYFVFDEMWKIYEKLD